MPVANVRGANINYGIVGAHGPWVALSPGGRRDLGVVLPLAELVAEAGYRVLIHDRRNCGASDVVIEGDESEYAAGHGGRPCDRGVGREARRAGVHRRRLPEASVRRSRT